LRDGESALTLYHKQPVQNPSKTIEPDQTFSFKAHLLKITHRRKEWKLIPTMSWYLKPITITQYCLLQLLCRVGSSGFYQLLTETASLDLYPKLYEKINHEN